MRKILILTDKGYKQFAKENFYDRDTVRDIDAMYLANTGPFDISDIKTQLKQPNPCFVLKVQIQRKLKRLFEVIQKIVVDEEIDDVVFDGLPEIFPIIESHYEDALTRRRKSLDKECPGPLLGWAIPLTRQDNHLDRIKQRRKYVLTTNVYSLEYVIDQNGNKLGMTFGKVGNMAW